MQRDILKGIPYYGENSIDIEEHIKNKDIEREIKYTSLLELISNETTEDKTVVIEDTNGVWLTYLRDIRFNYRDKILFIPYFTYKIKSIPRRNTRSNQNGHIILREDTIDIRYEYNLCKKSIDKVNNEIILYDITTDEKYKVSFRDWINEKEFSIDKLYDLYLNSCVSEEDYRLVKHTEGYHVITQKLEGRQNKERELRKKLELKDYNINNDFSILNYRDVRNYTEEQYIQLKGLNTTDVSYWKRILDFESYLYCVLRSGIQPSEKFKKEWDKLRRGQEFIKYGTNIKLIIKRYWLDNIDIKTRKTWSRV